jgi:hypothetical protein
MQTVRLALTTPASLAYFIVFAAFWRFFRALSFWRRRMRTRMCLLLLLAMICFLGIGYKVWEWYTQL